MIAQFEVGKTYSCRSICDYDFIFSFEVVKRTEKFVSLKDSGGKVRARNIRASEGV